MPKPKITEEQVDRLVAAIEQLEPSPPLPPTFHGLTEEEFLVRALAAARELLVQGVRPSEIFARWARDGIPLD